MLDTVLSVMGSVLTAAFLIVLAVIVRRVSRYLDVESTKAANEVLDRFVEGAVDAVEQTTKGSEMHDGASKLNLAIGMVNDSLSTLPGTVRALAQQTTNAPYGLVRKIEAAVARRYQ